MISLPLLFFWNLLRSHNNEWQLRFIPPWEMVNCFPRAELFHGRYFCWQYQRWFGITRKLYGNSYKTVQTHLAAAPRVFHLCLCNCKSRTNISTSKVDDKATEVDVRNDPVTEETALEERTPQSNSQDMDDNDLEERLIFAVHASCKQCNRPSVFSIFSVCCFTYMYMYCGA